MPDGSTQTQRTSLDLKALLRPTSPTTPMEAVEALIVGLGLPIDPALDRYIATHIERERVRYSHFAKEAARSSGVCISGMGPDPFIDRSPEDLIEAAKAEMEAHRRFIASPRGRFLAAVVELTNLGYYEAETARSIYSRSLADDREPLNTDAVGRCIRVLISIDHSSARDGVAALADLLAPELRAAA